MGLFGRKYDTLVGAIMAGDRRAVRKMLDQGSDPNRHDEGHSAFPLHCALNHGAEMVQLLIDHGADVNIPSRKTDAMPLAMAESRGYPDVAAVLRKAGARLRTGTEELSLDPRLRLQLEPKIEELHWKARMYFPDKSPEEIAGHVEEKLSIEFPSNMPEEQRESIRKDVRALIKKKCGVTGYLKDTKRPIPNPKDVMAMTGMSESELTRRFIEQLIQEGSNPFDDMPAEFTRQLESDFPDLASLARRKFHKEG